MRGMSDNSFSDTFSSCVCEKLPRVLVCSFIFRLPIVFTMPTSKTESDWLTFVNCFPDNNFEIRMISKDKKGETLRHCFKFNSACFVNRVSGEDFLNGFSKIALIENFEKLKSQNEQKGYHVFVRPCLTNGEVDLNMIMVDVDETKEDTLNSELIFKLIYIYTSTQWRRKAAPSRRLNQFS
jgi:hypothetical protein